MISPVKLPLVTGMSLRILDKVVGHIKQHRDDPGRQWRKTSDGSEKQPARMVLLYKNSNPLANYILGGP